MPQESEAIAGRLGIGGNKPPLPTISERLIESYGELRDEITAIAARANVAPKAIKCQNDLNAIGTLIRDARATAKKANDARVAEKEPFLSGGRDVDSFFKTLTDRLDRISQFFQKIADEYQRAVAAEARRKAEEEARKARQEEEARLAQALAAKEANRDKHAGQHTAKAEAAGVIAEQAEAIANAPAADLTRQRLDSGVLATSKEAWTFEITDYGAIPLGSLGPYFKREHVEQAIRLAVKMGHRNIPGVRIYEDIKASFR